MTANRSPPALLPLCRCAAVFNGALAGALACVWVWMGLHGLFWRADFSAFYTGWTIIREGRGERLYDLDLQADTQARLLPERPADQGLLPFVNPPHAALALAPLALLPRPAAFAVWTILQVGMCLLAGHFLLRLQTDHDAGVRTTTLLTALAFPPLFMSFQMGQVSLWCLVCLLGFVRALQTGRPLATAAWIAAGTIKPQLMVVPCLLLLGLRRWRELVLLAALLAGWVGLTTLVLGPRCWLDYLALLRFHGRQFGTSGIDPLVMYNLKGFLTFLLGAGRADLINSLTVAAWLAGAGLILWLWRDARAAQGGDFRGRLALSFLLGVLVNPHLNPTDALVLVLPALLFHEHLGRVARRKQALSFAALAVACPLLFLVDWRLVDPARLGLRPFFLLLVAVAGWMAVSLAGGPRLVTPRQNPLDSGLSEVQSGHVPTRTIP